ncbi:MAG: two-component system OmpR family response regulator [Halieaceae bacterium]|jgi:two-component system OmpR family response regulator
MKILVVEDDDTTLEYLKKGLQENGYTVDVAQTGPDGLFLATSESYALILLDRMLPQLDGLAVLAALRAAGDSTPVIILSALGQVDERIEGLSAGGDDYLTKPFSFAELLIRVNKLIARSSGTGEQRTQLDVADLSMDLLGHRVFRAGSEIKLQAKEYQLLRFLLEHLGQVVSRTLLFESVWDYHFDPKTNVIDVHIANLRKKLESNDQSQLIHTVRGAGYVVRES